MSFSSSSSRSSSYLQGKGGRGPTRAGGRMSAGAGGRCRRRCMRQGGEGQAAAPAGRGPERGGLHGQPVAAPWRHSRRPRARCAGPQQGWLHQWSATRGRAAAVDMRQGPHPTHHDSMGMPLSSWKPKACGELSTMMVCARSRPSTARGWRRAGAGLGGCWRAGGDSGDSRPRPLLPPQSRQTSGHQIVSCNACTPGPPPSPPPPPLLHSVAPSPHPPVRSLR